MAFDLHKSSSDIGQGQEKEAGNMQMLFSELSVVLPRDLG